MIKFIIEYWNSEKCQVECFSNEDGLWKDAPRENVIIVYITRMGVRPYGKPDKLYTQKKSGVDNYFFAEKDGIAYFGGWNDCGRPNTLNWWYPDGHIESKMIIERPKDIPDELVKTGVWVEEPWAMRLGLSQPIRRTIKSCTDG